MLEDQFIGTAVAHRLRSCPFGAYLDEFCSSLVDRGYKEPTIRYKLWVLSALARWMANKQLALVDLDERCVEEFLKVPRRRGRTSRGFRSTALLLIEQLRCAGAIPVPEPIRDDSPAAALLRDYESYLRQERALAESTIGGYVALVRQFIMDSHGTAARPQALRAGDIHDFLLTQVRRMAPKRAQYMGSALRSFLRFLFLRGKSTSDLSLAVPTVRQ